MIEHPNSRTINGVTKIIEEIQHLLAHPRMKQRNWIERGKAWLQVLEHAREDLQRDVRQQDLVTESYQSVLLMLDRIGLKVEKRDTATWGYRWHGDDLKGAYGTRAEAIEAGLRERLRL